VGTGGRRDGRLLVVKTWRAGKGLASNTIVPFAGTAGITPRAPQPDATTSAPAGRRGFAAPSGRDRLGGTMHFGPSQALAKPLGQAQKKKKKKLAVGGGGRLIPIPKHSRISTRWNRWTENVGSVWPGGRAQGLARQITLPGTVVDKRAGASVSSRWAVGPRAKRSIKGAERRRASGIPAAVVIRLDDRRA